MILSEYASTEMSLHALYMHEVSNSELGMEQGRQGTALSVVTRKPVCMQCCREGVFGHLVSPTQLSRSCFGLQLHKQHAQLEPERHTWHRRESDESGESAHEELDAQRGGPIPIPRSASYPFSSPRQPAEETATLQTGFQRRYGGITGTGARAEV